MKRILSLILALAMIFCLGACSFNDYDDDDNGGSKKPKKTQPTTTMDFSNLTESEFEALVLGTWYLVGDKDVYATLYKGGICALSGGTNGTYTADNVNLAVILQYDGTTAIMHLIEQDGIPVLNLNDSLFVREADFDKVSPGNGDNNIPTQPTQPVIEKRTEITLWTYPIGQWGDQRTVDALISLFESYYPYIMVRVEYLNYTDGDDKVITAIEGGCAPDIIMEGPERLVANWGAKGLMVDLADMFNYQDKNEIYNSVLDACFTSDGKCYEYPLAMTAHTMAINKNVFEAAGAMMHINEQTHTWKSVDDFFAAIEKVYVYTGMTVGTVFCGGQGGDQGTRALVTNLYGGTFTNAAHTKYTWNSSENIAALQALRNCNGIVFDASLTGGDEIREFYKGNLNMAFCWNIVQQQNPNYAYTGAGKTANGDEILYLAFPSDATPQLQGGVWGFGVFDNGNDAKIEAAKLFIKFMCDSEHTVEAVRASGYFAVRTSADGADLSHIWDDNAIMQEYDKLMPLFGDYYQVTPNWATARTAWWNMLQEIGDGNNIATVVKYWEDCANDN